MSVITSLVVGLHWYLGIRLIRDAQVPEPFARSLWLALWFFLASIFGGVLGGLLVASGTLDDIKRLRQMGADARLEDVFLQVVGAEKPKLPPSFLGA